MIKNRTEVAVITAAHGIRGQVKLRSFVDDLSACGILSDATGVRIFSITLHSHTDKGFIASINGITDRNAAELLRGTTLYAISEKVPSNPSRTLIGLFAQLNDGSTYGTITGMYNFGAGDIVEIEKSDGASEMLPLQNTFVEIKDGYVLVHPPEYLEAYKK